MTFYNYLDIIIEGKFSTFSIGLLAIYKFEIKKDNNYYISIILGSFSIRNKLNIKTRFKNNINYNIFKIMFIIVLMSSSKLCINVFFAYRA